MEERAEVTQLLVKMFSDRNSVLVSQNVPLWICFLGRFVCMYDCMCVDIRICNSATIYTTIAILQRHLLCNISDITY